MFSALTKTVPSHLLDPNLFDFKSLQTTGQLDPEGDKAFDEESFSALPPVSASGVLGDLLSDSVKRNVWSD
jgi:tRNA 2-thiocytidine biosynthesis protein TtcA